MFGNTSLKPGDPAPDFTLQTDMGKSVRLSALRGKNVVLFFYPKDESPGCTAEACSFRDAYDEFTAAGAEVIGISSDSAKSHEHFRAKFQLPMTLLSDPKGQVRREYRIENTLGFIPGRVTFLIDKKGTLRHVFASQLQATRHVKEALDALHAL